MTTEKGSKHSPGPWNVRFTLNDWVASYDITSTTGGQRSEREYLGECQANCALIEAAPDLLAFAEWVAAANDNTDYWDPEDFNRFARECIDRAHRLVTP